MQDKTMTFSVPEDKEQEMRKTPDQLCMNALKQKGYNRLAKSWAIFFLKTLLISLRIITPEASSAKLTA